MRVIPPGKGILHQINLEHLSAGIVTTRRQGRTWACADSLLGTDSHSTMAGGIGLLGWGVGGIEAIACMLGLGVSLQWPEVVGVRLTGRRSSRVLASNIALHLTNQLRAFGVVDSFIEFIGPGMETLSVSDRATIANMAPEYGATVAFFPIDVRTLEHFAVTGQSADRLSLIEAHARAQGLWHDAKAPELVFNTLIEIDLSRIGTTLAGPKRPDQALDTAHASRIFADGPALAPSPDRLSDGDIVLAAITSCTNTANAEAMITAGLLAERAVELGLTVPAHIKTSFAPGSWVVERYLKAAGLLDSLEKLGFSIVGFGCTTCVGNSGPLRSDIQKKIVDDDLDVCAVLSGNRNFEMRIHKSIKSSFLMSPPMVIAAALAGSMRLDLDADILTRTPDGSPVRLSDLWPTRSAVESAMDAHIRREDYQDVYGTIDNGDSGWRSLNAPHTTTFGWQPESEYIRRPPQSAPTMDPDTLNGARILLKLGDTVTTDHISPVGAIDPQSPAGQYLLDNGVARDALNTYGARRGNYEVMLRGTFANARLMNRFLVNRRGGWALGPDATIITRPCGATTAIQATCAIRTAHEFELYRCGGVLAAQRHTLTATAMNAAGERVASFAGAQAISERGH